MSSERNTAPNTEVATEGELPIRRFAVPGSSKFGLEAIWTESTTLQAIPKHKMMMQLGSSAWRSFSASPLTAFLTLLTISIVLTLFGAFILLLQNISGGVSGGASGVSMRLFLFDGVAPDAVEQLRAEVASRPGIKGVRVISKDNALAEFRSALREDATLLDGLEGQNPLPQSLEVTFTNTERISAVMDEFAAAYRTNSSVQQVQYSQSLVGQLSGLIRLIRVGGSLALVVMVLVTAFVVATTIRLALYSHRQEIQIMRLVGARGGFIRAPFLIEGVAEGALGSVVAVAVLYLAHGAIVQALSGSDLARVLELQLSFLSTGAVLGLLLLGPALGLAGSFLAVRRFEEES